MRKKKVKIKMTNSKSSKGKEINFFLLVQKALNYKGCCKLCLCVSLAQNNIKGPYTVIRQSKLHSAQTKIHYSAN